MTPPSPSTAVNPPTSETRVSCNIHHPPEGLTEVCYRCELLGCVLAAPCDLETGSNCEDLGLPASECIGAVSSQGFAIPRQNRGYAASPSVGGGSTESTFSEDGRGTESAISEDNESTSSQRTAIQVPSTESVMSEDAESTSSQLSQSKLLATFLVLVMAMAHIAMLDSNHRCSPKPWTTTLALQCLDSPPMVQ